MDPIIITLLILLYAIILFFIPKIPLSATALSVPLLLFLTGVLDSTEAFSGFIDKNVIMFAGMFVIGHSVLTSGAAYLIADKILATVKTEKKLLLCVMLFAMVLSAFLSNTATVAMLVPIIAGICDRSGYDRKKLFIPLAFASSLGGMCSIIGSPPNLIVKSAMSAAGLDANIGFFEIGRIGVLLCVLGLAYFLFVCRKSSGKAPAVSAQTAENGGMPAGGSRRKRIVSQAVFAAVVILMIAEDITHIPMHIISTAGALVLVLTQTMSEKEAFAAVEWPTIFLFGGMLALAKAMSKTGTAELLSERFVALMGSNPSEVLLTAAIFFITCLLTQFMSNTAASSLIAPIAISVAVDTGYNPKAILIVVAVAASCAFVTPMATPPNSLVMSSGGYVFKDYVKVGLPLTLICMLAVSLLAPLLWSF